MTYRLIRVQPEAVDGVWPSIEAMVADACARSRGRFESRHVQVFARSGIWTLWLVVEEEDRKIVFVGGTDFNVYPTGLKTIWWRFGTGEGRENWQHLMAEILAWAKLQGCAKGEGVFRRGWRRVFTDWQHTHEFLEIDL